MWKVEPMARERAIRFRLDDLFRNLFGLSGSPGLQLERSLTDRQPSRRCSANFILQPLPSLHHHATVTEPEIYSPILRRILLLLLLPLVRPAL